MIDITFDSHFSEDTITLLDEAIRFFIQELLPEEIYNNMAIDVDFDDEIAYEGVCEVSHEDDSIPDPREFQITISDKRDMVALCAHECVHIKQYATNQLSRHATAEFKDGYIICDLVDVWEGERWIAKEGESHYWDSPWEEEAYTLEKTLLEKWKNETHNRRF